MASLQEAYFSQPLFVRFGLRSIRILFLAFLLAVRQLLFLQLLVLVLIVVLVLVLVLIVVVVVVVPR